MLRPRPAPCAQVAGVGASSAVGSLVLLLHGCPGAILADVHHLAIARLVSGRRPPE